MNYLKIFFVSAFLMISSWASSQLADSTRRNLLHLLKERDELFNTYSSSLDQKSGFFGNRTKNDMRESHERLREIVLTDNRIMDALNRALEYRNFEKLTMTYDVSAYEQRLKNISALNDTLNAKVDRLEKENKDYRSTLNRYGFYFSVLILILVGMTGYRLYRALKARTNVS
jgi:hypothetical protein